jgi:hypothetical protein
VAVAPFDDEKREGRRTMELRRLCCEVFAASSVDGNAMTLRDRLGSARGPPGTTGALSNSIGLGRDLVRGRLVKVFGGELRLLFCRSFLVLDFLPIDAKNPPDLVFPIGRLDTAEDDDPNTENRLALR